MRVVVTLFEAAMRLYQLPLRLSPAQRLWRSEALLVKKAETRPQLKSSLEEVHLVLPWLRTLEMGNRKLFRKLKTDIY